MDKVAKYQDVLVKYLSDFASRSKPVNLPDVETRLIADRERNSFQVVRIGWQGERFVFAVVFHFDIKGGKIWFQCNNTEREVVDELMEMGVSKDDIVLGFQPPYARHHSGFAVA
ncbi:MAG: XisI protein [Saprospiraceae bacterium]